jgi:hypothetical protein
MINWVQLLDRTSDLEFYPGTGERSRRGEVKCEWGMVNGGQVKYRIVDGCFTIEISVGLII